MANTLISQEDYEYLKSLPFLGVRCGIENLRKIWYASGDKVLAVARILDDYDTFLDTKNVIRYFEKPWNWEREIQNIIKEYEGVS